jgi:protein O-mannosyl-transferase
MKNKMVLERIAARALLIILALVLLLYATALNEFPFVYDDVKQVLGNPRIQGWHGFGNAFFFDAWSFDEWKAGSPYYRPILALWLTAGWLLFQENAGGYHLGSLSCHVFVAIALFFLGRRLDVPTRALVVAVAIFVIHPITIQAVAFISAVGDPISALTVFGMCVAVHRADAREGTLDRATSAGSVLRRIAPLGLFLGLIASLSLERAWPYLSLPAAYLWFRHRSFRLCLLTSAAYGSVLLAVWGIRHAVLTQPATTASQFKLGETLLFIPKIFARYVENLALPHHLSLAYAEMPGEGIDLRWMFGLLGLVVVALAMWRLSRGDPRRSFLAFATLVPGSPILIAAVVPYPDYIQDRYVYMPLGFAVLWAASVLSSAWQKWSAARTFIGLAISGWCIALLACFPADLNIWAAEILLYERAVDRAPENAKYLMNLSNSLRRANPRFDEQCYLLHRARDARHKLTNMDEASILNYNLGNCHRGQGRSLRSLEFYADAYKLSGGALHLAKRNTIVVLLELGRLDDALSHAFELTRAHRKSGAAWHLQAIVLARMQRWTDAEQSAQKSIALDGETKANHDLLTQIRLANSKAR